LQEDFAGGAVVRAGELIGRHPESWREATRGPFLDGVREGTLPAGAFERWLVQDYLFVDDLRIFQSRLLARSPRVAQAAIAGGLVALADELGWFEKQAERRGLALDASRHPTAQAYRGFLVDLEEKRYPAGIVALWAIERAYLEAWKSAAPGHPDYREFVEHWTAPGFAAYVAALEEAAEAALESASAEERKEAEEAFLGVARLERDFWEMAYAGGEG
jgi:thiaminase